MEVDRRALTEDNGMGDGVVGLRGSYGDEKHLGDRR